MVALSAKDYAAVNGFSNQFWGWGGEDDDFGNRVIARDLKISRYAPEIARLDGHTTQSNNSNAIQPRLDIRQAT